MRPSLPFQKSMDAFVAPGLYYCVIRWALGLAKGRHNEWIARVGRKRQEPVQHWFRPWNHPFTENSSNHFHLQSQLSWSYEAYKYAQISTLYFATGIEIAGRRLRQLGNCNVSNCHHCFRSALTWPPEIKVLETSSGVQENFILPAIHFQHNGKKNLAYIASTSEV